MKTRDMVGTLVQKLSLEQLIQLWSWYAREVDDIENVIYPMADLDSYTEGRFSSVSEIVEAFQDFDINKPYFFEGIYGFQSLDLTGVLEETGFNVRDMVDYIVDCRNGNIVTCLDEAGILK